MPEKKEVEDLVAKYKKRLEQEFGRKIKVQPTIISKEYKEFKKELFPKKFDLYEKLCNFSE